MNLRKLFVNTENRYWGELPTNYMFTTLLRDYLDTHTTRVLAIFFVKKYVFLFIHVQK